MGLQNRGILAEEATVLDVPLKWLRYREKEIGEESPNRELWGHSGFQWRTGVTLTTLGKTGGERVTQ